MMKIVTALLQNAFASKYSSWRQHWCMGLHTPTSN